MSHRPPNPALVFFLMIRRPPRSTLDRSSAASDVYKRQVENNLFEKGYWAESFENELPAKGLTVTFVEKIEDLSLIHISEPTRPY